MSTLKAQQFLYKIASLTELQKETFSHVEIIKKVNEIKYLIDQKKTPRFIIKKEIQNLEEELKTISDLEKSLQKSRNQESVQVKLLKKKIDLLKKRLSIAEDKELPKKVEKLSHLLGEMLAKYGTQEDVELSRKLLAEVSPKKKLLKTAQKIIAETPTRPLLNRDKLQSLLSRVETLRFELEKSKILHKNPNALALGNKLGMIEDKLKQLLAATVPPEAITPIPENVLPEDIKHDLLFGVPAMSSSNLSSAGSASMAPSATVFPLSLEASSDFEELPLPPPPRIKG
ncbi:MAG: hypothetical protein V2A62_02495 [Candidatus Woesearchaeota archaeon]